MVRVVGVVVIAVFSALAAFPQQYTISTFAGGGPLSAPARATAVGIGVAATLVSDASGNIYFTSLNCAFKIDTNGILTQIAGNLRNGFTGDGGPAAGAQLNNPQGSAVDAAGNLYIADLGNNRVRKISQRHDQLGGWKRHGWILGRRRSRDTRTVAPAHRRRCGWNG